MCTASPRTGEGDVGNWPQAPGGECIRRTLEWLAGGWRRIYSLDAA